MQVEEATSPSIRYRPDVDGLRAVAVVLVLARHFETQATGGYVGVDVFFVISGYLISATILAEMESGRFTISGFYERRVRRIFPAMLVMMLVVTALAYHYLLPLEVVAYAKSLLAALLSGSNFLFWHQGGYFDQEGLKPLLHTWSLGVEEQFYILFPVFLVSIRRWLPRRMRAAVLGTATASFIAAWVTVASHPDAAFFFAPLRAWEFLMGTIVSQGYVPTLDGAVRRNLASGTGLLLILAAGWTYSSQTEFPGLAAVPPCLGAALILAAGETGSSVVGRVLAWRPVAFLGLISYSVYLWHWPLLVFQQAGGLVMHRTSLNRPLKFELALLSIMLGALSWRFVEQPFRKRGTRPGPRRLFAITGLTSLLLAILATGMLWARGMPGRLPPDAQKVASYIGYDTSSAFRVGTCFVTPEDSFADFRPGECLGQGTGKRPILLAGDSHAAMLWTGLSTVFSDRDVMQVTGSDCAPLVTSARADRNCKQMMRFLYGDYLLHHQVGALLLEARWRAIDLQDLGATIEYVRARGITVVVVGPAIEYDQAEPRVVAFALRDGSVNTIAAHQMPAPRALDREMGELARSRWHVPYISIYDDLCRPTCPVFAQASVPLLFDGSHMTAEGSVLLAKAIRANGQLP